jgi:hypothetical protein
LIKTQYVDSDLLTKYIKSSGLKIGHLAAELGISRTGFDKKRKGEIAFRASEVYVLCDSLKIPDDVKPKIFCLSG